MSNEEKIPIDDTSSLPKKLSTNSHTVYPEQFEIAPQKRSSFQEGIFNSPLFSF